MKTATPKELGPNGRRLWLAVVEPFEPERYEQEILRLACQQLDELARLDEVVVSKPADLLRLAGERRQARHAVSLLIGRLGIELADDQGSVRARRSGKARRVRDETP